MSSYLESIQIVYCIFLGIWWFIISPFAFYYCYKIWQLRNASFFIKRHPRLTIAVVVSGIYWVGLGRPIGDLAVIFPSIHKRVPIRISNSPLSQLCIALQFVRIWFLYFNYSYGLHTLSKQWQSSHSTTNQHWTLNHKWQYFGDKSPVLYYALVFYVVTVDIILFLAALHSAHLEYLLYTSFLIVTMIHVLVIAYKVRHFKDELFIHAEFKWSALIASIALCTYIIATIILRNHVAMQKLARHVSLSMEFAVWIYVSTKWVLDKYAIHYHMQHHIHVQNQSDTQATVHLFDILKNEETFELFALYLVKEFSIENLIFLYHSTQFKETCVRDGFIKEEEMGRVVIQFPKKIKSMQTNESMNYEYLVKRYADLNAHDSINIASATRKTMIGLMDRKGESTLSKEIVVECINTVDKAMEEIIYLLAFDSCARFMMTETFRNLYS
eukprot:229949_1